MKLTVIGLGLIGGSLSKDLKTKGFAHEIIGVEDDPAHAKQAMELGLVDEVLPLREALKQTDMVIIATPVSVIRALLPQILDEIGDQTTVTDMGSTKSAICQSVQKHPKRGNYVPSHPMAGTENSGPMAALSGLFAGKTAVICDREKSHPFAAKLVEEMYAALRMRLIWMSSEDHDLHAAYVSHLSHISSFVLANTVLDRQKNNTAIFDLAGGGFESTVRLAKSSPVMWAPIFEQNKEHVLNALSAYIKHLESFRTSIEADDLKRTAELMDRANHIRRVLQNMSAQQQSLHLQTMPGTGFDVALQSLRQEIDRIDKEVISLLAARMKIVEKIGTIKKDNKLPALQTSRWDEVMRNRLDQAKASNLSENFTSKVFQSIHEEAIRLQNELMKKDGKSK